jgi:predicted dehydrogenase
MMSRGQYVSRRSFLRSVTAAGAAAVAAPQIVPSRALGLADAAAPSNRITVGLIGTGSHGVGRDLKGFLAEQDAQVVAVCDVDSNRRQRAKKLVEAHYARAIPQGTYQGCTAYNDFREIIARGDIDAVCNATPDHWHAIPSIMAVRAGKDVLCEKPLTLTLAEGRAICDAVKRYNRVFQTGSETRSFGVLHRMCELVRNGRIGKVKHIEVRLPAGIPVVRRGQVPGASDSTEICDPPKGFDYNMWLGQAPYAPYCRARCHYNFRWTLDYSGGQFTDHAHHTLDIAQWGNNTEDTMPIEVEGEGTFPTGSIFNTATEYQIKYKYANGVTMEIASHIIRSLRFVGTEGWIGNEHIDGPLKAEPASILDSRIGPDETHLFTCPGGEIRNFLDCVKSRKPCYCPAEFGHRAVGIAHLGNIAMMVGRKLKWDPEKETFPGNEEANRMLSRAMREPWRL